MTTTPPQAPPTLHSDPHTLARASWQLSLLSIAPRFHITKCAQARNAYGTLAQEIVCAALRLDPIPINGNCSICFDAESRNGCFYEIKSARRSSKVVVYDWRMEKERMAKVRLRYAILLHNVRGSNGHDLFDEFIDAGLELIVIDAIHIHSLALNQPLKCLSKPSTDPRNGYARAGYNRGYRSLPVKRLHAESFEKSFVIVSLYQRRFTITLLSHLSSNLA